MTIRQISEEIDKYTLRIKNAKSLIYKNIKSLIVIGILHAIFHCNVVNAIAIIFYVFYFISMYFIIANLIGDSRYLKKLKKLYKDYYLYGNDFGYSYYKNYYGTHNNYKYENIYDYAYKRSYKDSNKITKSKDDIAYENSLKLMNLNETSSDIEIKSKYRELSKMWHPDMHTNKSQDSQDAAHRNFVKLNNAYECIKKKRNIK